MLKWVESTEVIFREDRHRSSLVHGCWRRTKMSFAVPTGWERVDGFSRATFSYSSAYAVGSEGDWRILMVNEAAQRLLALAHAGKSLYAETPARGGGYSSRLESTYLVACALPVLSEEQVQELASILRMLEQGLPALTVKAGRVELKMYSDQIPPLFPREEFERLVQKSPLWGIPCILTWSKHHWVSGRDTGGHHGFSLRAYYKVDGDPKPHTLRADWDDDKEMEYGALRSSFLKGQDSEARQSLIALTLGRVKEYLAEDLLFPYEARRGRCRYFVNEFDTNNPRGEKEAIALLRRYGIEPQNNGHDTPYRRIWRKGGYFRQIARYLVPKHPATRRVYKEMKRYFNRRVVVLPEAIRMVSRHIGEMPVELQLTQVDAVRVEEEVVL